MCAPSFVISWHKRKRNKFSFAVIVCHLLSHWRSNLKFVATVPFSKRKQKHKPSPWCLSIKWFTNNETNRRNAKIRWIDSVLNVTSCWTKANTIHFHSMRKKKPFRSFEFCIRPISMVFRFAHWIDCVSDKWKRFHFLRKLTETNFHVNRNEFELTNQHFDDVQQNWLAVVVSTRAQARSKQYDRIYANECESLWRRACN